jgi:nucleotide-binding universal stress UspA family protein
MIQTILFATDMGLHTHYLLHHVNALACLHNARVIVVHAIEPAGHFGDAVVQSYLGRDARREIEGGGLSKIIEGVKGRIVDVLEEEFIDGQEGLSNIRDVRVIPGKPVEVILKEAGQSHADMLVIGSHGHDTATPNMLGSVTSRILQLSRIPVYMVPLVRNIRFQAIAS